MENFSSLKSRAEVFAVKEVSFEFRGRDYLFSLSHGLFSSAGIDTGSRFLLKVFSQILDEDLAHGFPLPGRILDAGSGAGILGVCAAGALKDAGAGGFRVRAQDRDELGRVFTEYNARRNGFGPDILSAYTEPLLADWRLPAVNGPPYKGKAAALGGFDAASGGTAPRLDLIISNIPAKAGLSVLEDFIPRSAFLVNPGGRVIIVAVNTLARFFEERIAESAVLLRKAEGRGHTVFLYGPKKDEAPTAGAGTQARNFFPKGGKNLLEWNPSYLRNSLEYEAEKTFYHLETVCGAEGFDTRGGEVSAAIKLAARLDEKIRSRLSGRREPGSGTAPPVLVWEGDQGHFSSWFARRFFSGEKDAAGFVLAGRNILALEAAASNTAKAFGKNAPGTAAFVSAACLCLDREKILEAAGGKRFSFMAAFPKAVPQTDRMSAFWEGLAYLAAPEALVIISLPSAAAEKLDRKKPKTFTRLADIKRDGFRALSYITQSADEPLLDKNRV